MPDQQDELLTLEEVSQRLKISVRTLRRYLGVGKIECLVLNPLGKRRQVRISAFSLAEFISRNSTTLKTPERQKRAYNRSANYKPYARKKKKRAA